MFFNKKEIYYYEEATFYKTIYSHKINLYKVLIMLDSKLKRYQRFFLHKFQWPLKPYLYIENCMYKKLALIETLK